MRGLGCVRHEIHLLAREDQLRHGVAQWRPDRHGSAQAEVASARARMGSRAMVDAKLEAHAALMKAMVGWMAVQAAHGTRAFVH